ncbi:hypothetical protein ACWD7C_25300 [Streptomyces sp. NPDC005134]|uniref:hypothetical protein n=1 Tax=unclassified Streptomyces TaxID=2593676 RepID=UPI0033A5020E
MGKIFLLWADAIARLTRIMINLSDKRLSPVSSTPLLMFMVPQQPASRLVEATNSSAQRLSSEIVAVMTGCDRALAEVARRALADETRLPKLEAWFRE